MSLEVLDTRFPGKRAVITGAASGLGLAAAELLASRGWNLLLLDRDGAGLGAAARDLTSRGSPHCEAARVDTTDEIAVKLAIDAFAGRFGGLDFAFNSAGVAVAGDLLETPVADWHWILGINVMGVVHSCRAEAPHMIASKGGLIVNVASAASFTCLGRTSAYSASKAAVVALSEALFQELAEQHVQVAVAMPGFFRTRLMETARAPADARDFAARLMERSNLGADAVAREIIAKAAGGAMHIVLPGRYRWLWRFKRFAPGFFQRWLAGFRQRRHSRGG